MMPKPEDILGQPIRLPAAKNAAREALLMVKGLREDMPDIANALRCYTVFERTRNPRLIAFADSRDSFFVAGRELACLWHELCLAMDAVCEHYKWQAVSSGGKIDLVPSKAISLRTLADVERAANRLLAHEGR